MYCGFVQIYDIEVEDTQYDKNSTRGLSSKVFNLLSIPLYQGLIFYLTSFAFTLPRHSNFKAIVILEIVTFYMNIIVFVFMMAWTTRSAASSERAIMPPPYISNHMFMDVYKMLSKQKV
jgi:hypothetical protein